MVRPEASSRGSHAAVPPAAASPEIKPTAGRGAIERASSVNVARGAYAGTSSVAPRTEAAPPNAMRRDHRRSAFGAGTGESLHHRRSVKVSGVPSPIDSGRLDVPWRETSIASLRGDAFNNGRHDTKGLHAWRWKRKRPPDDRKRRRAARRSIVSCRPNYSRSSES